MAENHEIYLAYLESVFGRKDLIKKHDCPRGGPPVTVFIYRDVPEKGMISEQDGTF